jgi:hypothetical protein
MRTRCRMPVLCASVAIAVVSVVSSARAGEIIYDDFAVPYLERTDSIYPGAGNAKSVNSAIHTIDPWPRPSANRHIPANGERMAGAVERYRDVSKLPKAPPPIAPVAIEPSGFSGSGGAATSGTK